MTIHGTTDLEKVYDTLATSIDRADAKRELFLAKLALMLAHELNDAKLIGSLCNAALKDL